MDTFLEMDQALQDDLTVGPESTFFTPEVRARALTRAYRKAGGLFRWPDLQDARDTSSITNQEDYDFPTDFRSHTIWKLIVNGSDMGDPISYKDYQYEKENSVPSGMTKMWAVFKRKYFIYPTPTTNGSKNISIWGQEAVDTLVNPGDTTIFSYSQPECNEAIVLEAGAILKAKGGELKDGQFMSAEAKQILSLAWNDIKRQTARYEKTTPFFDVPDLFPSGRTVRNTNIGNFP